VLLILAALWLTGCGRAAGQRQLQGTLLVWHTWPAPRGEALDAFFDSFMEINPAVTVVSEYVPLEDLLARFNDQAAAGLGPDLIIGVTPVMTRELAGENLLADLTPYEPDVSNLSVRAVDALRVDVGTEELSPLFGLPIAAHTQVLFFNKSRVKQAPQTLNEVLEVARNDQIVAFPSDFQHSFWGIRGFGGEIVIDGGVSAEGVVDGYVRNGAQVTIDGGLDEWLQWLQSAQKEPNIILSDDPDELYALFASGRATYYIGESIRLPQLREQLGEEAVGVAYLPDNVQPTLTEGSETSPPPQDLYGAGEPPGAFLDLEVAAVSNISARKKLALKLLLFLTNPVHQRRLASRDLGYAPINQRVRFDHRLSPSETTIVRQSGTAVIVSLQDIHLLERLSNISNAVYAQVLEGVLEPEEAAAQIQEALQLAAVEEKTDPLTEVNATVSTEPDGVGN
jgi:ABC-type glycerol-3-phosphate transport system substrate-binding protein